MTDCDAASEHALANGPQTLLVRPAGPDDVAAIAAIRNRCSPELIPLTAEDVRHEVEAPPTRARAHELIAEWEGRPVGFCLLRARWWSDDPTRFTASLVVEPAHEGNGAGTALYGRTISLARAEGATLLYVWVREDRPDAERFALRRGFEPTGTIDRLSRLDVQRAAIGDDVPLPPGIRLASLAEIGVDEATLRAIHELDETTARDVPSSDAFTGSTFEEWKAHVFNAPGISPASIWLALDGNRTIGLTWLEVTTPDAASTGYTGVLRDYRGQGIARMLKERIIHWAREDGIRSIYTSNAAGNAPMLAINTALGFEFLPDRIEMARRFS